MKLILASCTGHNEHPVQNMLGMSFIDEFAEAALRCCPCNSCSESETHGFLHFVMAMRVSTRAQELHHATSERFCSFWQCLLPAFNLRQMLPWIMSPWVSWHDDIEASTKYRGFH